MSEITKEPVASGVKANKGVAPSASTALAQETETRPLVIDMGKASRRRLKQLRRGRGKLMSEVMSAVEEIRQTLGTSLDAELLPVVVTYRRKRKGMF